MSDEAKPVVVGRPFIKGDPRINLGGPKSGKLRKFQAKLASLDDTAFEFLKELLAARDKDGLALWMKYRLPVPKLDTNVNVAARTGTTLSPALAARLAALDS